MHQSVYELVHTEDQQELRRNLHWALNPPAAASTSSQDSPQGDSPVPHQLVEHLDLSQKMQSKKIEAVLHFRALEPNQGRWFVSLDEEIIMSHWCFIILCCIILVLPTLN